MTLFKFHDAPVKYAGWNRFWFALYRPYLHCKVATIFNLEKSVELIPDGAKIA
jgi:hypothetical protein